MSSRSSSFRAAAIASSSDVSSLMTQFFMPFERVLNSTDPAGLPGRGRFERVARAAALAEGLGQDFGHHAPGRSRWTRRSAERPARTGREYNAALFGVLRRSYGRHQDDGSGVARTCPHRPRRSAVAQPQDGTGRRACGLLRAPLLDSGPDMGPLAAVERFLERLFERQTARLFRTAIRPVQVQRRLERSMESQPRPRRCADGRSRIGFVVRIVRRRADRPAAASPGPRGDPWRTAPSRSPGATATPCSIDRPSRSGPIRPSHAGDIVVERPTRMIPPAPAEDVAPVAAEGGTTTSRSEPDDAMPTTTRASGGVPLADDGLRSAAVDPGPPDGGRDRSHRRLRRARGRWTACDDPRDPAGPFEPDDRVRWPADHDRTGTRQRVSSLRDGRASRHHARIDGRRGSLVLADLGSTNGSYVNDRRVESIALGEGDRIRIGTTTPDRRGIDSAGSHSARSATAAPCRGAARPTAPTTDARSADGPVPADGLGRAAPLPRPALLLPLPDRQGARRRPARRRPRARHRARPPRRRRVAGGRAGRGHLARARRDRHDRPRRQQRDRRRRPVRLGRARDPDLPWPGLVRRGPRQHERHVRQRGAGRGRGAARLRRRRSRSARSACGSSARAPIGRGDDRGRPGLPSSSARSGRGRAVAKRGFCSSSRSPSSSAASRWSSRAARRRSGRIAGAEPGQPAPPRGVPRPDRRCPPRPDPVGPTDGPGPAAGHGDARRDQPAADGAPAADVVSPDGRPLEARSRRRAARVARAVVQPRHRSSPSPSGAIAGCASTSTRGRRPASPCSLRRSSWATRSTASGSASASARSAASRPSC